MTGIPPVTMVPAFAAVLKHFLIRASPTEKMLEAAALVPIDRMDALRTQSEQVVLFADIVGFYSGLLLSVVSNKATKKFKELSSLSVVKSALRLVNRIS
jgi:hypothetical protein